MEFIEFYQLKFLDIDIKHVLLYVNPMSGQSATYLKQYAMFQVNLIFSIYLLTELDQLYDLTASHENQKKKNLLKTRLYQWLTWA